jgi:hypothetical protein
MQLDNLSELAEGPEDLLSSIEASYGDFPELHIPSMPEVVSIPGHCL